MKKATVVKLFATRIFCGAVVGSLIGLGASLLVSCSGRIETSHEHGVFGKCVEYEFNASHVDLLSGRVDFGGGCVWIKDLNPECADMTECVITCTSDLNDNETVDGGEPQKHIGGKLPPGSQYACFDPQTVELGFDLSAAPTLIDVHTKFADGSDFNIIHNHAPAAGSGVNPMPRMGKQWTWSPQLGLEVRATQTNANIVTFVASVRTDARTNDARVPLLLRLIIDGHAVDDFDSTPLQIAVPLELLTQERYGARDARGLFGSHHPGSNNVQVEVYDANGLVFSNNVGPVWAF